ncbi:hypothetical protein WEI85_05745 [Actinomycetes bacterium KLBMP 9797]
MASIRRQVGPDGGDPVALDQHVRAGPGDRLGLGVDDVSVAQQEAVLGHGGAHLS